MLVLLSEYFFVVYVVNYFCVYSKIYSRYSFAERGYGKPFPKFKYNDVDLFEQMDDVREFMGVCPQYDVLFDLLTPREHLDIFFDFKGGDPARKQE